MIFGFFFGCIASVALFVIVNRMKVKYLVLFLCLLANLLMAQSDQPFVISNIRNEYTDLNQYLYVLQDKEKVIQLSDLTSNQLKEPFVLFRTLQQPFNNKYAYWGKITIVNKTNEPFFGILFFGAKRHSDFATAYISQDDSSRQFQMKKSGYYLPLSEKNVKKELGSKVELTIAAGESKTIYVNIHNISHFSPNFKLKLQSYQQFTDSLQYRNWYHGFMHGILLILFLYNLLVYFISKDRPYLYYAFYILIVSFNFLFERGFLIETIFGEIPQYDILVFSFSTTFIAIFYILFANSFLSTKHNHQKFYKLSNYIIVVKLIQFAVMVLVTLFAFNIKMVINIGNIGNFIELGVGITLTILLIKDKNPLAFYFNLGTASLVLSTLVSIVLLMVVKNQSFDPKIFMNVGVIVEILFFSLGLGERIRLIEEEKQKAQSDLINQLVENELLQTKVNRELEDKVRERTAEIEQQKEEIRAQADNLEQVNEVLQQQNEEINQQKAVVVEQNKKITDSIIYAKRIQKAVLIPSDHIQDFIPNHFIFLRPRDIVSGDFYLIRKMNDSVIVVAADCTGHGVPGAFMSMLGIAFLNEIINKREIIRPAEALNELRIYVKKSLGQSGKMNEAKDGMDIAFCAFNTETRILQFAGANNPLWLVRRTEATDNENLKSIEGAKIFLPSGKENLNRNTQELASLTNNYEFDKKNHTIDPNIELVEFKGDNMPIGVYLVEKESFTNHEIEIKTGDTMYLFSDGYADQIGGRNGKKFLIKNFRNMLLSIQHQTMEEQKKSIDTTISLWMGTKHQQIDDILVLGVRI